MILDFKRQSLAVHVWDWYSIDQIIDALYRIKPKTFFYNASSECELGSKFNDDKLIELNNAVVELGIDATLALGSYSMDSYHYSPSTLLPDFKFKFFPFFFLQDTLKKMDTDARHGWEFKQLFYSQNNRPKEFRCMFVDTLVGKGLHNFGKFTWNILTKDYGNSGKYKFKHWKEEIISADDIFQTVQFNTRILNSAYTVPEDLYFHSLWDVVTESSTDCIFLTEKTWKPIFWYKPFLIYAAKGTNKALEELGFKLFHSLIDYTFDEVDDMQVKADLLCKELNKLKEIDLETQYKEVNGILRHNRQLAINIGSDPTHKVYNLFTDIISVNTGHHFD